MFIDKELYNSKRKSRYRYFDYRRSLHVYVETDMGKILFFLGSGISSFPKYQKFSLLSIVYYNIV